MSGAEVPVVELRHEVLQAGDERAPRRWPWLVLLAVAVAAAGLWWLDGRTRADELAAFEGRVSTGQQAVAQSQAHVSAMLAYGNPVLSRADLPTSLRSSLEGVVRDASREGADALGQEREALQALNVRPWHRDITAAVTAYAAYLDARIVTFDAGAQEMNAGFEVNPVAATTLREARSRSAQAAAGDPALARQLDELLKDPTVP